MTSLHEFDKMSKVAKRVGGGNILTLDIETSPTTVYTFDMKPNWISPDKIIEPSVVMCFAAKWYDENNVQFYSSHHQNREEMVQNAWDLLDRADVLVTFNGVRFDVKHLKREFVLAGLPMPRPWKDVDLYREAKKQWEFESKGLNHLAQRFELGKKEAHEGFDLWRLCLAGDKSAWERMKAYNVQDVVLTEQLYDRMRGWIPNHPHMGAPIGIEDETCNQCGSTNLVLNGTKRAVLMEYSLYRCMDCGANVQGNQSTRVARTRGA